MGNRILTALTAPEGGQIGAVCNACEMEDQFIQLTAAGQPDRDGEPQGSHIRRLFGEVALAEIARARNTMPRATTHNLSALIWAGVFAQMRLRLSRFEDEVRRDWPLLSRQPWMVGLINAQYPFNRSSTAVAHGNVPDSESEDSDISLL